MLRWHLTTDSGLHWKSSRTAFAMVEILTNREESKKIDLNEVEVLCSTSDVKLSKILQRKQEIHPLSEGFFQF